MNYHRSNYQDVFTLCRRRLPGQLVIQFTDCCNATCPQCGMRVTEKFPRSTLSETDIKRILEAAAQKGMKVISFTGGEPLLFLDDLVRWITYAGELGFEYIRTGTNGFIFKNPWEIGFHSRISKIIETLAATPLRNFWISLDSTIPAVHDNMRGFSGITEGIQKALPIFHEHGLYPSANLGINRNLTRGTQQTLSQVDSPPDDTSRQIFRQEFRMAFNQFYQFVVDLGFTMASVCYPMSVEDADPSLQAVYAASSISDVIRFSPEEKRLLYQTLLETVPEFRSALRIVTPLSSLYSLARQGLPGADPPYPCRGGIDFFFIDAKNGHTYPCGYRGHDDMGPFWDLDLRSVDTRYECRQCDWECFRDPSEVSGPFLQGVSHPFALARKFFRDPDYLRLWLSDLRYTRASDLFDGRTPPDFSRLARCSQQAAHRHTSSRDGACRTSSRSRFAGKETP